MGASAERRPTTQASDELKRGDLVLDNDLGGGVVLDDLGSGRASGVGCDTRMPDRRQRASQAGVSRFVARRRDVWRAGAARYGPCSSRRS